MQIYKRTMFNLIKGIVLTPFGALAAFIITQIFLPVHICAILGIAVGLVLGYITIFSENISFELDGNGMFRYFKNGKLQNTFELSKYRIGYYRKTESGFLGNVDIDLKLVDSEGEETGIDAGPLGTSQFDKMFEQMEKFAIKNIEVLNTEKK
ncbi:MAG: hypothetical protein FWH53_01135 [Leptospirales bacterium]|nr:hypothetical protein [Leptospirales bacterium]